MTMVERFARVIAIEVAKALNESAARQEAGEPNHIDLDDAARAAIAAMRQPSEEMSRIGEAELSRQHSCSNARGDPYVDSTWQAMIDAALAE